MMRTRSGRAQPALSLLAAPQQVAARHAGEVPRADERRDAVPQAVPGPRRQRRLARGVRQARADHRRGAQVLDDRGFIEVRAPVLQPALRRRPGPAVRHHHNELERDLYLRIATELYLKRCIIGGIDRLYEIGKDLPQRGRELQHKPRFHDARVLRGLRGLQPRHGHRRADDRLRGRGRRPAQGHVSASTSRPHAAVAAPHHAQGHRERDRYRHRGRRRAHRPGPARAHQGQGPRGRGAAGPHLGRAGRRAVQRVRRAQAHPAGVHHRASARDQPVRQEDPARPALRGAVRGLHRRHGAEQRLQRAQRPRRPARALPAADGRPRRRRRDRAPARRGTSSRPWSTACRHRRPWAWASTAS